MVKLKAITDKDLGIFNIVDGMCHLSVEQLP